MIKEYKKCQEENVLLFTVKIRLRLYEAIHDLEDYLLENLEEGKLNIKNYNNLFTILYFLLGEMPFDKYEITVNYDVNEPNVFNYVKL